MTPFVILTVAAPTLLGGYGALRIVGMSGGRYGPDGLWQVTHLVGLAAMVLFVPVAVGMARLLPGTWWRTLTVAATLVGLAASMVQFGADMVEAAMTADRSELKELSHQFTAIPGVTPAFYTVGPQLFFLGLIALAVLLAIARRVPWWSPVLISIGVLLPPVTLDLIPVTALLMAAALLPIAIGAPVRNVSLRAK